MIVVDVETGGLDPEKNPLLSIGAVDFNNHKNTFYGLCRPLLEQTITTEALEINGFTLNEVHAFPSISTTLTSFLSWVKKFDKDNILAGHNPRFDLDFIRVNCDRCELKCPFSYRTVDLHTLAFAKFGWKGICETKLTSERIYELLDMEIEPRPHNALTGAIYEAEAFRRLMDTI